MSSIGDASEGEPMALSVFRPSMRTAADGTSSEADTAGFARKMRRSATAFSSSTAIASDACCFSEETTASSTARPGTPPRARRAASCTGPFSAEAPSARNGTVGAFRRIPALLAAARVHRTALAAAARLAHAAGQVAESTAST
jgi:hypothetical protein